MARRKNNRQNRSTSSPTTTEVAPTSWERHWVQIKQRAFQTVNLLTIPLSSGIVYAAAILVEYLILELLSFTLSENIKQIPFLEQVMEYVLILLASLTLLGMLIHTGFSLYNQVRIEWHLTNEDEGTK